jgi:TetR/AcrR family transcriptional repressor of nem operon
VTTSSTSSPSSVDKILTAATRIAQAHGYGGLNLRTLAEQVGIKAGSLYHHFPSKADLAAAVARRYAEDSAVTLDALATETGDPALALRRYPETFRRSLENDNRMCLCSFMAAEYDDLPTAVQTEIQAFAEVNVAWLGKMLQAQGLVDGRQARLRASAIFAAVSGAQLMARGRNDLALFDALMESYRGAGLFAG